MKLYQVRIKNFRGYNNELITFSDLSAIIGKNDVGKSSILDALDIFFNDGKPEIYDLNVYSESKQISISCIFDIDPDKEIQIDYSDTERTTTTLKKEYLLNKHGFLEIEKVFDFTKSTIKSGIHLIAKHPNNFENSLVSLKLTELKKIASDKGISLQSIDSRIKKEIRKIIWENTELIFDNELSIDTNSKDGDILILWNKIKQELPEYMLFRSDRTNTDKDKEVNDTTKAIAKNVVAEISEQFENIKNQVNEKIQSLALMTLSKLKEFDPEITSHLQPNIEAKALENLFSFTFSCDNGISFNKRGSGVKRLMLLSFFLADAERKHNTSKTIIYAIEEPETSQHPDFQKRLFTALEKLSNSENRQVFITTHTPEIVKLLNKDNLIFLQKNITEHSIIIQKGSQIDKAEVAKTLGILPFIENKKILFVEGPTDIQFLMHLNDIKEFSDIINLKQVTIIPMGGAGRIEEWVKEDYLKETNAKRLYFIDRDNNTEPTSECVIRTSKKEIENYIPYYLIEHEFDITFSNLEKTNWDNINVTNNIYCHLYPDANHPEKDKRKIKNKIKEHLQKQKLWDNLSFSHEDKEEIKSWFEYIKNFYE